MLSMGNMVPRMALRKGTIPYTVKHKPRDKYNIHRHRDSRRLDK
jgi:hypothetical protein